MNANAMTLDIRELIRNGLGAPPPAALPNGATAGNARPTGSSLLTPHFLYSSGISKSLGASGAAPPWRAMVLSW